MLMIKAVICEPAILPSPTPGALWQLLSRTYVVNHNVEITTQTAFVEPACRPAEWQRADVGPPVDQRWYPVSDHPCVNSSGSRVVVFPTVRMAKPMLGTSVGQARVCVQSSLIVKVLYLI
jgi:hypothetical protein